MSDPYKEVLACIIEQCGTLPLILKMQERYPTLFVGGSQSGSKAQPLVHANGSLVKAGDLEPGKTYVIKQSKGEVVLPKAKQKTHLIKGIRP